MCNQHTFSDPFYHGSRIWAINTRSLTLSIMGQDMGNQHTFSNPFYHGSGYGQSTHVLKPFLSWVRIWAINTRSLTLSILGQSLNIIPCLSTSLYVSYQKSLRGVVDSKKCVPSILLHIHNNESFVKFETLDEG